MARMRAKPIRARGKPADSLMAALKSSWAGIRLPCWKAGKTLGRKQRGPGLRLRQFLAGEFGEDALSLTTGQHRLGKQGNDLIRLEAAIKGAGKLLLRTGVVTLFEIHLAQQKAGFGKGGFFCSAFLSWIEAALRSFLAMYSLAELIMDSGLSPQAASSKDTEGADGGVPHPVLFGLGTHLHGSLNHVEISFLSPKRFIKS
jgi:hypothetical protein